MPKALIQVITLLLVSCLAANPAAASTPLGPVTRATSTYRFQEQALMLALTSTDHLGIKDVVVSLREKAGHFWKSNQGDQAQQWPLTRWLWQKPWVQTVFRNEYVFTALVEEVVVPFGVVAIPLFWSPRDMFVVSLVDVLIMLNLYLMTYRILFLLMHFVGAKKHRPQDSVRFGWLMKVTLVPVVIYAAALLTAPNYPYLQVVAVAIVFIFHKVSNQKIVPSLWRPSKLLIEPVYPWTVHRFNVFMLRLWIALVVVGLQLIFSPTAFIYLPQFVGWIHSVVALAPPFFITVILLELYLGWKSRGNDSPVYARGFSDVERWGYDYALLGSLRKSKGTLSDEDRESAGPLGEELAYTIYRFEMAIKSRSTEQLDEEINQMLALRERAKEKDQPPYAILVDPATIGKLNRWFMDALNLRDFYAPRIIDLFQTGRSSRENRSRDGSA